MRFSYILCASVLAIAPGSISAQGVSVSGTKTLDLTGNGFSIDDLPAPRWYVGGQAVQRPAAMLEITVTSGTNTPAQKAAFVQAAFTELRRQLAAGGELEEASYVTVREVPATDWGYGGVTQHDRAQTRMRLAA